MKKTLAISFLLVLLAAWVGAQSLTSLNQQNQFPAATTTLDPVVYTLINNIVSTLNGYAAAAYTFTNKTLTAPIINNPVISGPAPVACGASCSPTTGQLVYCATAAGCTLTLPTSAGSGNVIRERITTTTTSGAEKVLLTTTGDVIVGTGIGENGGTAKVFVGNAGTYHSIQMPYTGMQPSGGFNGDLITCTDMAAGTWACDIQYQGGTTPTTPYSTSTT